MRCGVTGFQKQLQKSSVTESYKPTDPQPHFLQGLGVWFVLVDKLLPLETQQFIPPQTGIHEGRAVSPSKTGGP